VTGLEEGQYPFTFLLFIMGIALLQAALNAVAPGYTLLVFHAVLFIDDQVTVGVGDWFLALITFYFT